MCAAPVKNMRTIFPATVVADTSGTTTTTTTVISPTRTSAAISGGTLASVAAAATVTGTLTMAKSFMLQQVVSTFKVRVRLYSTAAARDADVNRANSQQIAPGTQHGMICDLYLNTADKLTWVMSPAVDGSDMDAGTATIYFSVTNLETTTKSLSVTFTYLPLET